MLDIPCVIFAGGKSSRMGEDKALLPFGKFKTLTQFQLSRLSKIFKTVYISCKDKSKFDFDANFIEDSLSDSTFAPTAGFVASFKELKSDRFFVISVDAPFVSQIEINKIIKQDLTNSDVTIAKSPSGTQPMCGIYHKSLEKEFLNMLKTDSHKLGYLLKNSKTTYVNFADDRAFLNLNNPQEYQKALTLI